MNPKTWSEMISYSRELELSLGNEKKIIEENETESVLVQEDQFMQIIKLKKFKIKKKDLIVLRPYLKIPFIHMN